MERGFAKLGYTTVWDTTTRKHPPTAAMNEATQGSGASAQPGSTAQAQHPATAAMNQASQGSAASPQDVQSQTRGGPTAAQQAEGARSPASDHLASAQAALEQARNYDRAGQEASCMDAIARNSWHISRHAQINPAGACTRSQETNPFRFRLLDFLGPTRSSLGVPLSACSLEQAL
jgi:hypothetical protein